MEELLNRATQLLGEVNDAIQKLKITDLEKKLEELAEQSSKPDFWQDQTKAKALMKEQSQIAARVEAWRVLEKNAQEIVELSKTGDETLIDDLAKQLNESETKYNEQKTELMYSGSYAENSAIVGIYAGAGGTDAQDWAAMLLRMYLRWAEAAGMSTTVIYESSGEEAGIKSVGFEVNGPFAYARLKGEHGVHRLVRLSPFNADNLRQTSFAKVEVSPKIDKPDELAIDEKDLKVDVFRSGGSGGQSVNTTDSAVRVTHKPTGIVITIQNERSQLQNKETALTVLRSRLAQLQQEQHAEKVSELKGPSEQASWGNQIRNYVLHPYKQVKDLRTKYETSDPDAVLNGKIDDFINAYLEQTMAS